MAEDDVRSGIRALDDPEVAETEGDVAFDAAERARTNRRSRRELQVEKLGQKDLDAKLRPTRKYGDDPKPDYVEPAKQRGVIRRHTLTRMAGVSGGRPAYVPTAKASKRIRALAMLGVPLRHIAMDQAVSVETIKRHYPKELEQGELEAYAQVAGRLFRKAMDGDTIAMIFWMKARVGWKDRPTETTVEHTHTISHEERLRILERGPALLEHEPDEGDDHGVEGAEARFTPDGSPIIDAEEEDPEPLDGPALNRALDLTEGYAAAVRKAKKVEGGKG